MRHKRRYTLCGAPALLALALLAPRAVAREPVTPERAAVPDRPATSDTPAADSPAAPERQRPASPRPEAVAPRPASSPAAPPGNATATEATSAPPATAPGEAGAASHAERAKRLYALGAEAFAAQRNADAIRYFRRAAELVPSAKLTYNIGLAYEEMGDGGRALVEYRAYLAQDAEGERREEVIGRMRSLERQLSETGVQQLSVLSRPAGATVRVAGRPVGVTPWAGELAPGLQLIQLDLPGFAPRRSEVLLQADRAAELSLELVAEPPRAAGDGPSAWSKISPVAWTFIGVGAGALGGGIAFEVSRARSSERAGRSSSTLAAAEARGAADAKQMASLSLLGFGAGFLIGGTTLLVMDLSASDDASGASPTLEATLELPCAAGFCGISAQGRF